MNIFNWQPVRSGAVVTTFEAPWPKSAQEFADHLAADRPRSGVAGRLWANVDEIRVWEGPVTGEPHAIARFESAEAAVGAVLS